MIHSTMYYVKQHKIIPKESIGPSLINKIIKILTEILRGKNYGLRDRI
jgi:hypothetical protein